MNGDVDITRAVDVKFPPKFFTECLTKFCALHRPVGLEKTLARRLRPWHKCDEGQVLHRVLPAFIFARDTSDLSFTTRKSFIGDRRI